MGDDLVSCSTATPWPGERVSGRPTSSLFASCFSVISTGMASNRVFEPTFPEFRVSCGAMIASWIVSGKRYVTHVRCRLSNPRRGVETLASKHPRAGGHNAKNEAVGSCVRGHPVATSGSLDVDARSPHQPRHPQSQHRPAQLRTDLGRDWNTGANTEDRLSAPASCSSQGYRRGQQCNSTCRPRNEWRVALRCNPTGLSATLRPLCAASRSSDRYWLGAQRADRRRLRCRPLAGIGSKTMCCCSPALFATICCKLISPTAR